MALGSCILPLFRTGHIGVVAAVMAMVVVAAAAAAAVMCRLRSSADGENNMFQSLWLIMVNIC